MKRALVLFAGLIVIAGCGGKSLTTEPDARGASASSCASGCDGVLHVPQQDQASAAMLAARDAVRAAVDRGELTAKKNVDWNSGPHIDWQACYFYVSNGDDFDSNGNKIVGGCAAGMTDYPGGRIVIATNDPNRTIPLVKWEATNYDLTAIGHSDLCDQWQSTHPM